VYTFFITAYLGFCAVTWLQFDLVSDRFCTSQMIGCEDSPEMT